MRQRKQVHDVEVVPARRKPAAVVQIEPGLDDEDARKLVDTFLGLKRGQTLRAYTSDLEDFAAFMFCAGDPARAIAKLLSSGPMQATKFVSEYVASLKARPVWRSNSAAKAGKQPYRRGLAPNTINRRLSALKSICTLARVFALIPWELQVGWERVVKYRDTRGIEPEARRKLFAYLQDRVREAETHQAKFIATRDYAMVRVLYDHALRRSEMVELQLSDVQFGRWPRIWVLGKGAREHESQKVEMALSDTSVAALRAYLEFRGDEDGPLFQSAANCRRPDRGMATTTLNKLLAEWCHGAGIERDHPHSFRHAAITKLAKQTNGNVFRMQSVSRHVSIQTLTTYVHNAADEQRRLVNMIAGDDDEAEADDAEEARDQWSSTNPSDSAAPIRARKSSSPNGSSKRGTKSSAPASRRRSSKSK